VRARDETVFPDSGLVMSAKTCLRAVLGVRANELGVGVIFPLGQVLVTMVRFEHVINVTLHCTGNLRMNRGFVSRTG
jgi:hypothetical protein